jgi:predicted component of type VI protein secretion system
MQVSFLKVGLSILFLSVLLSGCASQTPILDQHFGEAVNASKAQQTINLDASQNQNPVAGVDGQAANDAVDRYHKSFTQPPAATSAFTIGVGTGGGASK